MSAPDPVAQSIEAKAIDRLTIRIVQARNGYILKTHQGQFVYGTLNEAAQAVVDYFAPKEANK